MRVFISHASKNRETVLRFAKFLEEVSANIDVFCSSEKRGIDIGRNFVDVIFKELNSSDIFVPIISKEYYESKFCMIELGVAYSCLSNRNDGREYIFPFALDPLKKGLALSGTPLNYIQTGSLSDEDDIHNFLEYLSNDMGLGLCSGINRKIQSFEYDIGQIFLKSQNIVKMAKFGTYFDDSIEFEKRGDIVSSSATDDMIVINFNMNPYERQEVRYPSFISLALRYVDKLDIGRYLYFNSQAEFHFMLTNFTNSLKKIFVEFKYSDNNSLLDTFEFSVGYGENKLSIPLERMVSNALNNISEICFVIHPDDIVEEEGMFKIGEIEIK